MGVVWNPPPDMDVRFHAERFPNGTVPNAGTLVFNEDDLAHALFVTGRAPADRTSHGRASVYEWLHRVTMVPAYLQRDYNAKLVRSGLAVRLDRSEKMIVSYLLGQAMTQIFCESQLQVVYLMHVDRYAGQFDVTFGATRRRPDLFGLAPRGWVVAEAKGSSSGVPRGMVTALENQKRSISDIRGERPWMALGCVAHFPRGRSLHLNAYDPEEEPVESLSLDISRDRFVLAYYLPFLRAIEMGDAEDEASFSWGTFSNVGLRVGMPNVLLDRVRQADSGEIDGLFDDVQAFLSNRAESGGRTFSDGTGVRTAWGDGPRRLPPEDG
jgi:hypothetical protein